MKSLESNFFLLYKSYLPNTSEAESNSIWNDVVPLCTSPKDNDDVPVYPHVLSWVMLLLGFCSMMTPIIIPVRPFLLDRYKFVIVIVIVSVIAAPTALIKSEQ